MKRVHSLVLAFLVLGIGTAPVVFADADTPGSSTNPGDLRGSGNLGSTTYVEVHSGTEVRAASQVTSTDAVQDTHPLTTTDGGGDD